ncbi:MAG: YdcF family protein [Bdellovibrionales bacterium]|nr:YdcF family protein [Bdellovibrionales bacterium]
MIKNRDIVLELAKTIWDFHFIQEPLSAADCIVVLGSHDLRIAEYACDLFNKGLAPYIIFSGATNFFTAKIFSSTEAEVFAAVASAKGIPEKSIIIENKARNTEENLKFSQALATAQNLCFNKLILVQTPNMLRRVKATALKLWPEKTLLVSSHDIPFESCTHAFLTEEMFIHEIVGDLQRVILYPKIGYQVYQEVPAKVLQAYATLLERGFTGNLIPQV